MADYTLELIEKRLKDRLIRELSRTGLLFRLFSRVKDENSIKDKFARKTYSVETKKMQDLVGFRITTYFNDDLKIVKEMCQKLFEVVELVFDYPNSEEFRPLRKNMICRIPKDENEYYAELIQANPDFDLIDNTFEIQFRTTLSEGWHEVDHLMRYKCKPDWDSLTDESRMLNGIYASLETSDQALRALFEDISFHHYKARNWEAMLRNKLRLRFTLDNLDNEIINHLNDNPDIGKRLFKMNRQGVLEKYIYSKLTFPTTFNNWMYFINYTHLKDELIMNKCPKFMLEDFSMAFNNK